jgi:hypothetical protein
MIDSSLNVTQVYDLHQPIKGACERASSSGKRYILFAEDTKLHQKELPGLSSWNDVDAVAGWPKVNLTSATWHTMINVGGDALIANDSKIAMVGYDDSYTNEALDLIPGNIAKTMLERNGRLVTGTFKKGNEAKGTNAIIDSEVPLAQVGDSGQIMYADFVSRMPIKTLPGGGKVNPGGVANELSDITIFDWQSTALSWINKQAYGNLTYMGVYGATSGYNGIYSYGRREKNKPFVLNLEYLLDVDEIGAVCFVNGTLIASYQEGSGYGVKAVDSLNKATAMYNSLDFKAPQKLPINITKWTTAELFLYPLPAGCSIQFWYKTDKYGSFIQALTATGSSSFETEGGKKAVFAIGIDAQIFEHKIIIVPSGNNTPEIYRERIYFS